MRHLLTALILITGIAGCAPNRDTALTVAPATRDWRSVVTASDRERLRDWRPVFMTALDRARAAGHGADIAREGRLLEPDAGIGGTLPNGEYRCRIIKLGAKYHGLLDYVVYPGFSCRVQPSGELQGFAKLTGSQRPVGLIFPSDQFRQVFLGSLVLGDEPRALQYGRDPDRDVAGWVERIGPAKWRIVLPSPRFESLTDVIELVPAGQPN